ncbi:MAG: FAD-binding protein [Caldilineaceae bacterium]|nr:FAD-binding protein [Caldilineaceae bacterium]
MSTESIQATQISVQTVDEISDAVRGHLRLLARGGGSKPALSTPSDDGATVLDLSQIRGVQVYDPGEFTFTALAGTPLHEVATMLAERGQYLPFDPPLAGAGATLGGTIAAGLSGPGRYRYGGVRDFLIGIRFVNGRGDVVRGGGNVVKNAAGFDFSKLMVGSLGRLGILTEVTFKVFPAPAATASLAAHFADLNSALDALVGLSHSKFDLDALDLVPSAEDVALWVRLGGLALALPQRLERLTALLNAQNHPRQIERFGEDAPAPHWSEMDAMTWRSGGGLLVKIPVTPKRVRQLDPLLADAGAVRRYSSGGNTAWINWPGSADEFDPLLSQQKLAGLVLDGPPGRPWLGRLSGRAMLQRIAATLDPEGKFGIGY